MRLARPQRPLALHLRAGGAQVEHGDQAPRPQRGPLDLQGLGWLTRRKTTVGHPIVH
jgi:hypothetical protein